MVVYNFKSICVVPSSKDFVDIVLSKTQRKTPTVVHAGYAISRIRKFYMRKVKFTQDNYHEKINQILVDFPRFDDIHPFYADLMNVLYSKDHYKLALGQINTAKSLVDNIGKDYLKLLKFGDSLYRCKELKKAALGRMCTVMKKLGPSLQYLEQVRQHLSRLPSIDPSTRTIMITGYPNVGKSSFINKVSNANVEVQPYAFTTKSLFVGHTDYQYMRWQVIDTPGILDHPMDERNTIEMQAITALAHLHSTVLYFLDPSEQCGYSLQQQVDLFHNIKPLFANKPLLIVANKTDLKNLDDLSTEESELVASLIKDRPEVKIVPMSNMTEQGIQTVLHTACDLLLAHRVEKKLKSKRINEVINRIQVAVPVKRDNKSRPVSIPPAVLAARAAKAASSAGNSSSSGSNSDSASVGTGSMELDKARRKLAKDIEIENGGPGIFNVDLKANYDLANPEWKYDIIPEIMNGKNIADFVDPDIERQLEELEREEDEYRAKVEANGGGMGDEDDDDSELDEETQEKVSKIRTAREIIIATRRVTKTNNKPVLPRQHRLKSISAASETLEEMGLPSSKFAARTRAQSLSRPPASAGTSVRDNKEEEEGERERGKKRGRSRERGGGGSSEDVSMAAEDDTESAPKRARSKSREMSSQRDRSKSHVRAKSPFRDAVQAKAAGKLSHKVQRERNRQAKMGEGDRHVYDLKPKHLYSGKRDLGTHNRR